MKSNGVQYSHSSKQEYTLLNNLWWSQFPKPAENDCDNVQYEQGRRDIFQ